MSSDDTIPIPSLEFMTAVGSHDSDNFALVGQHVFELVRYRCAVQPDGHILDIGSGCGRVATHFTRYMSGRGNYDGFDVVLPMVEWCKANISTRFQQFRFQHVDLANTVYSDSGNDAASFIFPYANDTFDTVFAASVFTHLVPASTQRYASEIARVLKPAGKALLTFFIIDDEFKSHRANSTNFPSFPYDHGDYSVEGENRPEAAIAYLEHRARSLLHDGGLRVDDFSYGTWRKPGGWTYQDAFLLSRR